MRILHLAFEDPRMPGSGGGALRTQEINNRLAERHQIEIVTCGWRGARDQVEPNGLVWKHTRRAPGRARGLTYYASLPGIVSRTACDLIVEDFGPPMSTLGLPRFTRRPVVGVVQFFFARQKALEYHLPFGAVESWGVRQHTDLIAVSHALANELRARSRSARVEVVENGIDPALFALGRELGGAVETPRRPTVLYIGRLEIAQKGLDVLINACATLVGKRDFELVIAGAGPDEVQVRRDVDARGMNGHVRFLGEVSGATKVETLASASAVVVPSRYETFGMVVAEAMAARTPVIASDIPCLRDLLGGERGWLVPPNQPIALANAIERVLADPEGASKAAAKAAIHAERFRWSDLAAKQEEIYIDVVARRSHEPRRRHLRL